MDVPENRTTNFLTKPFVLTAVGLIILVLIVWDVFLAADDIGGNTWSELLRSAGKWTPVVPWLGGVVMGHWFHPKEKSTPIVTPPGNAFVLIWFTFVVALLGLITTVPTWVPVPLGALAGALLWPVSVEHPPLSQILGRAG